MYRVMIVEDDLKIAAILTQAIQKYGYETVQVQNFANVKSDFIESKPDLVILDINLPQFDGYYWCRQIRVLSNVPILFLSARTGEMDQVMAIENGGDDYITKPFHLDLIMAKIKSVLRRAYGEYAVNQYQNIRELDGLFINRSKSSLEWNEQRVFLSQKEFLLFECLAKKKDEPVSRDELLEVLWDDVDFVDDNTLTVNVTRVRKKLEDLGIQSAIETVRGVGYRLNVTWRH